LAIIYRTFVEEMGDVRFDSGVVKTYNEYFAG
jgi:hypothetical protein